jgi:hypothetical protein
VIDPGDEEIDSGATTPRVRGTPVDVEVYATSEKRAYRSVAPEPGSCTIRILPDPVHDSAKQVASKAEIAREPDDGPSIRNDQLLANVASKNHPRSVCNRVPACVDGRQPAICQQADFGPGHDGLNDRH